MYGSVNKKPLYANFWILILRHLPEAWWCKLYLNSVFLELLKSQKSIGDISTLSEQGKLESLKGRKVDFVLLCKSNIHAVKRYCYYHQKIDLNPGLQCALNFNKINIACFLIENGAKINIYTLFYAIHHHHDNLLSILKNKIKMSILELCHDDNNFIIKNENDARYGQFETLNGINYLKKHGLVICQCHNPRNHPIGFRGPMGSIGSSCGIGVGCRSNTVSKYWKKKMSQNWNR